MLASVSVKTRDNDICKIHVVNLLLLLELEHILSFNIQKIYIVICMRNSNHTHDNIFPYITSHMIKAGYYFGSHMTGSISNQFTNEISMQRTLLL